MFSAIVSPNNPRVKSAVALRESRIRRREGQFLVDGFREVNRAFLSGFELIEVFLDAGKSVSPEERVELDKVVRGVCSNVERRNELKELLITLENLGVPIIPLASNVFSKLEFGDRNEGVIAVVRSKITSLDELDAFLKQKGTDEAPLLAVVEGVEKPGNIGAILRSADGAGLDALMIAADSYDVFNPNAIRGSLGAIFHLPVVVSPSHTLLEWLRHKKIQRATALCNEAIPYVSLDYSLPTAIVLGSEAEGLTDAWAVETEEDKQNGLLQKIRLPMLGIADSLNVSNAAAVLFYEARRVRS